jgi:uncharacterized protein (TIGR02145 family)
MKKLVLIIIAVLVYQFIFSQEVVTDIDGYEYNTVQIGNQTWLKENLRVTKYNDGTPITNFVTENIPSQWSLAGEGPQVDACTYYNLDLGLERIYGKLYNGYVIRNDKNVCPIGWKIPSDADLTELVLSVDPNAITDSLLWGDQSTIAQLPLISDVPLENGGGGTNETGFSFLSSGYIQSSYAELGFSSLNNFGGLWSTTPAHDWEEDRNYTRRFTVSGIEKCKTHITVGAPIRCLKDVNYNPSAQIEEIKIDYVVYPNPVVDQLNVVVDQSSIGKEYTITDMSGKILIKDQIPSQEFKIDMSDLSGGVYKIEIGGKQKRVVKK